MDTKSPEWHSNNLHSLEEKLGLKFCKIDILESALTRKSYKSEHLDSSIPDNNRLEFLGDSVLKLLMSEHLFNSTEDDEGDMTINRVKMENNKMLSSKAEEMQIWDHVLIGEIETMNPTMKREHIMSNVLEAIVGAIFLDKGYDVTKEFFTRKMLGRN